MPDSMTNEIKHFEPFMPAILHGVTIYFAEIDFGWFTMCAAYIGEAGRFQGLIKNKG